MLPDSLSDGESETRGEHGLHGDQPDQRNQREAQQADGQADRELIQADAEACASAEAMTSRP